MTVPGESRGGRTFGQWFAAFWFVAGFPLSLSSPGATVAMAMAAAYGLVVWRRGTPLPHDLRRIGKITLPACLGLFLVDMLNGGSVMGNLTTLVDYLPVLLIPLLAFGYRLSGVSVGTIDRVLMATVALAVAMSVFQLVWHGVPRPGGYNLNPIPYAFVVMVWGTFLLARGLGELEGRAAAAANLAAFAALAPIVLSGSRAVWVCTAASYGIVALRWIVGRRSVVAPAAALLGVAVVVLVSSWSPMVQTRIAHFWMEADAIAEAGSFGSDGSIGRRVAMITGGWLAFVDKPILGNGLAESMQAVIAHNGPNGPDLSIHTHIHNDYVAHMVAYGIFGLLFLAVYFWLLLRLAASSRLESYAWAGRATAAALALYMIADIGFNMDPMTGAMAIVAGLLLCFPRPAEADAAEALEGRGETRRGPI